MAGGRPKLIALQEPSFVTMHSVNGDPSRPAMFEEWALSFPFQTWWVIVLSVSSDLNQLVEDYPFHLSRKEKNLNR
eukprot:6390004-Amphidinium_carterae.1